MGVTNVPDDVSCTGHGSPRRLDEMQGSKTFITRRNVCQHSYYDYKHIRINIHIKNIHNIDVNNYININMFIAPIHNVCLEGEFVQFARALRIFDKLILIPIFIIIYVTTLILISLHIYILLLFKPINNIIIIALMHLLNYSITIAFCGHYF